ncbi:hypothetical protein ACFL2T_00265 [Elusimicrobiota bacterium]
MSNRFRKAARDAAKKTNEALAADLEGITRLPKNRLAKLFPKKADKENLQALMEIVRSSTNENERIDKFKKRSTQLAGVALKLMKAYVNPATLLM